MQQINNTNNKNNKEIEIKPSKNNNILISKKPENNNLNNVNKKSVLKENNKNITNNLIKNISSKGKETASYLPIKINNVDNKEETNNNQEKKENINIFRELGQFVSSTMNKINKYTRNH